MFLGEGDERGVVCALVAHEGGVGFDDDGVFGAVRGDGALLGEGVKLRDREGEG